MGEIYQYPLALNTEYVPYIQFHAIDWKVFGKNRSQTASVKKVKRGTITLPMPTNGLTDSHSQKWEEDGGLLLGAGLGGLVKSFINKTKDSLGDILKGSEFVKGVTVNDFASGHYEGAEFREFTFEFSMVPNSLTEAENIIKIIKFFNKNSAGTLTESKKLGDLGSIGLKYPAYWEVEINFPNVAKLKMWDIVKFKELVMTNITTNYFPDNITTVFKSGHPIKIDLSITVKELEKMYSTDYM